jgi:hypothetical protein
VSIRQQRSKGYRNVGLCAGLLCLLIPCTEAWPQGKGLQAEEARQRRATKGLQVAVQEGRLSVDVQEADLGEVLAQIGRQAGIRISSGPSAGKRVSARFAGVELEDGLRRLLRAVSLSHSFLYAKGPAGTVTIAELRVLGEGNDASPGPATVAEPGVPAHAPPPGPPIRKAHGQAPEEVETVQEPSSEAEQGEPSEAIRRLLDVFSQSKRMGARPSDDQATTPPNPALPAQAPRNVGEGTR